MLFLYFLEISGIFLWTLSKKRFLDSNVAIVTGRLLKLHFIYANSTSREIEDKAFLTSLIDKTPSTH